MNDDSSQTISSTRFRRGATVGMLLLLLVAATLATTTALGLTFQGSGDTRIEGLLLTANRDKLEICVETIGVPQGSDSQAKAAIEDALPALANHEALTTVDIQLPNVAVEIGCPSGPALLRPGADVKTGAPGSNVEEASRFRVFVFVLSEEEITRLFGDWPSRRVPQEVLCEDHVCVEVTTGVYVSAGDLSNDAVLREALATGIGLERPPGLD